MVVLLSPVFLLVKVGYVATTADMILNPVLIPENAAPYIFWVMGFGDAATKLVLGNTPVVMVCCWEPLELELGCPGAWHKEGCSIALTMKEQGSWEGLGHRAVVGGWPH